MAEIDTLRGSHETIHVVRVKTPFRSIRYSSWSSRDCIPTMRVSRMHPLGCWSLVLVLLQPHTPICVHGCDDYDLSGTVIVNHASLHQVIMSRSFTDKTRRELEESSDVYNF